MNSRIQETFAKLRKEEKTAFISFITAGDPDLEVSEQILRALPKSGVDIIELGIPFSDSMADGVIIQEASQRALAKGMNPMKVFEMASDFRKTDQETPIILMGYFNPILAMGLEDFAIRAKNAGVDGLLVVDLPPEESDEFQEELKKNDLDLIFLTAPTTNEHRMKTIFKKASGFVYYVTVTGVTGTKLAKDDEVNMAIQLIKYKTSLPIVTGFGIKTPDMAERISKIADGVVVGSAIVDKLAEGFKSGKKAEQVIEETLSFVTELANSVKNNNNSN